MQWESIKTWKSENSGINCTLKPTIPSHLFILMCIEVNPSPYKIKCIFSQYIKHINELSIGEVWQYEAVIKWTSYWINTSTWFISWENIVNKFYHSYFNRRELNSCWAWFKETLQKLGTDINNLQIKPCWICLNA